MPIYVKEITSENQWIQPKETLPPGYKNKWQIWKSLNRLRTGVERCKVNLKKWGLLGEEDTTCSCGQEQSMAYLIRCPESTHTCSKKDLIQANQKAIDVAQYWAKTV